MMTGPGTRKREERTTARYTAAHLVRPRSWELKVPNLSGIGIYKFYIRTENSGGTISDHCLSIFAADARLWLQWANYQPDFDLAAYIATQRELSLLK